MYSVNRTCVTGSEASVLHKMPEVPPPAGSKRAMQVHQSSLREQIKTLCRTSSRSGVCWGFTNIGQWRVRHLHSVGNAPALKTHLYTLTHLDHSPPALLCQGKTTHGRSRTSPEGEGTGGAGPEEEGQIKGDINVLGVCE